MRKKKEEEKKGGKRSASAPSPKTGTAGGMCAKAFR